MAVPNDASPRKDQLEDPRANKRDAELVIACRKGVKGAWDELIDRFQRLIYTIPLRAGLNEEEAADVFQEVFVTLLEKLNEIEQPDRLRSWLVTVAKFKTWAVIRSRRGYYAPADDDTIRSEMDGLTDSAPLADDLLIELEEQHMVRTAVDGLDERCQQIIGMLYLSRKTSSYAEVAKSIGVGETSISPLRTRCLKKLASILSK
jgi:RNA polymerase sigma factor (sigma-70 family)